jgi:hypothetical protein
MLAHSSAGESSSPVPLLTDWWDVPFVEMSRRALGKPQSNHPAGLTGEDLFAVGFWVVDPPTSGPQTLKIPYPDSNLDTRWASIRPQELRQVGNHQDFLDERMDVDHRESLQPHLF